MKGLFDVAHEGILRRPAKMFAFTMYLVSAVCAGGIGITQAALVVKEDSKHAVPYTLARAGTDEKSWTSVQHKANQISRKKIDAGEVVYQFSVPSTNNKKTLDWVKGSVVESSVKGVSIINPPKSIGFLTSSEKAALTGGATTRKDDKGREIGPKCTVSIKTIAVSTATESSDNTANRLTEISSLVDGKNTGTGDLNDTNPNLIEIKEKVEKQVAGIKLNLKRNGNGRFEHYDTSDNPYTVSAAAHGSASSVKTVHYLPDQSSTDITQVYDVMRDSSTEDETFWLNLGTHFPGLLNSIKGDIDKAIGESTVDTAKRLESPSEQQIKSAIIAQAKKFYNAMTIDSREGKLIINLPEAVANLSSTRSKILADAAKAKDDSSQPDMKDIVARIVNAEMLTDKANEALLRSLKITETGLDIYSKRELGNVSLVNSDSVHSANSDALSEILNQFRGNLPDTEFKVTRGGIGQSDVLQVVTTRQIKEGAEAERFRTQLAASTCLAEQIQYAKAAADKLRGLNGKPLLQIPGLDSLNLMNNRPKLQRAVSSGFWLTISAWCTTKAFEELESVGSSTIRRDTNRGSLKIKGDTTPDTPEVTQTVNTRPVVDPETQVQAPARSYGRYFRILGVVVVASTASVLIVGYFASVGNATCVMILKKLGLDGLLSMVYGTIR
jgi:hypothetical protein